MQKNQKKNKTYLSPKGFLLPGLNLSLYQEMLTAVVAAKAVQRQLIGERAKRARHSQG